MKTQPKPTPAAKEITEEKLEKYVALTSDAFQAARNAPQTQNTKDAREKFLDTIQRYIADAQYFTKKGDWVNAFAALNYAHGWLDAGAAIGLWKVSDSRLFAGVEDVSKE